MQQLLKIPDPISFFRNNSTKDLESFAEAAISINRMMQQHLIINEPSSSFFIRKEDILDEGLECDEIQNDDETDTSSVPSFRLSPPCSNLAMRRQPLGMRISVGSSGFESGGSLPDSQSSLGGEFLLL